MVTAHSANINWLPISEDDSNGAILGYKIILMSGHNNTMEFNVTAQASDSDFSFPFSMLKPNTTYRFYMYGYNINGDGPESGLLYFTTKGKRPPICFITDLGFAKCIFKALPNLHLRERN